MSNQRIAKPSAEEVIPDFLDGDVKENALNFAVYMRENKIPLKQYTTARATQSAKYKGKEICRMVLYNAKDKKFYDLRQPTGIQSWLVMPHINHINEYENVIINEGLHNTLWENIKYCVWGENSGMSGDYRGCSSSHGCAGGTNLTVCGKTLKGVGFCRPYMFWNPGEMEIKTIKRLLELEKNSRTGK